MNNKTHTRLDRIAENLNVHLAQAKADEDKPHYYDFRNANTRSIAMRMARQAGVSRLVWIPLTGQPEFIELERVKNALPNAFALASAGRERTPGQIERGIAFFEEEHD